MRFALIFAFVLLLPTASFAAGPTLIDPNAKFPRETLTSDAAIVLDAATGETLFEHRVDDPRVVASLTKLMTSIVALEQAPKMTRTVKIAAEDEVGGGRLHVPAGTSLTTKDLFYSALVGSANNAAEALLRTSGLSRPMFLDQMNVRAATLGMNKTRFTDPSGMDVNNVSTARDLAKLARYAYANPTLSRMTATFNYKFTAYLPGRQAGTPKALAKSIKNTNRLLVVDPDIYITGGKTGYLDEAQYNLAIRAKDAGRQVIVVTLGADTRAASFDETKALAHWAFSNYRW